MKVIALYHRLSDHGGMVVDYVAEFERYKKKSLDLVSLETTEGADLAELYAVDQYPAILVMGDDGSLLRLWQGLPLPLMDELSYYAQEPVAMISRLGRSITPLASATA